MNSLDAPAAGHFLVIASDVIGPQMAGPSIRAFELARALARAGIRVTLAAPRGLEAKEADRAGAASPESADQDGSNPSWAADAPSPAQYADSGADSGPLTGSQTWPFDTVAFDQRGEALRRAAEGASGVFLQGLTLEHFPFLGSLNVPLAIDLYDPFHLENLAQRAEQLPAGRFRHHASDLAALGSQLTRGDYFVCASQAQRDYWLGCLTLAGRVNPATYDHDQSLESLIGVVPFGLAEAPPRAGARPVLRGVVPGIEGDDFVLLWGGGVWNWFDPLTLIRALAAVVPEAPRLKLFFMGTRSPSVYEPRQEMLRAAEKLAAELGLLDRHVIFNHAWVPYEARGAYLLEADAGASFHLPHIETRYAFRTRLLDCIWAGLPMLVTEGDVLADLVRRERLGVAVPPGDVRAAAAGIRQLMKAGGRGAHEDRFAAVRPRFTWSEVARPLAEFAAAPRFAADRTGGVAADGDAAKVGRSTATPLGSMPRRALEIWQEGGPLLLAEEAVRYVRWLRRPR